MRQDTQPWCRSPWLTVTEGARYLRMNETEFARLVDTGKIASFRRGKRYRLVNTSDLDVWMRSQPSGAKVPEALRSA